jgi:hypothetical protein
VADLSLVWFSINDDAVTVTRDEVRAMMDEYEFPVEVLTRDSKVAAFVKACRFTSTYVDSAGQQHELKARQSKRTSEFLTYQLMSDTGMKLAEYKFFQSRRNRSGLVPGSSVARYVIRQNVDAADRAGAQAWLDAAEARYTQLQQEPPWAAIRKQARVAMLTATVPVIGRETMYFVYDDDIETVYRVRQFLAACSKDPDFTIITVDDFSDYTVFAASADVHLVAQLDLVMVRIRRALESGSNLVSVRRTDSWKDVIESVRAQLARHERRLSLRLPQTRSSLLDADQLMSKLPVRPACRP